MVDAVRGNVVACGLGRRARLIVAAVAATLLPISSGAQVPPVRLEAGRFTAVAFQSDSLLAATLLRRATANDTFAGLPRPRETVLISIAPDRATFRTWVGDGAPEWGAAFAIPSERRIIMQGRSAPSDAGDPAVVLRHELAHLALHEFLGGSPPRWFDEGYASWTAGEWGREEVIAANLGLALRGFRTLAALDSAFGRSGRSAEAAYALAHQAVGALATLDADRGLSLLFENWRSTGSFDLALRRAHGMTTSAFELYWQRAVRRRYGGLALFADVTLSAFVMILFVTPFYLLRRRRDRARLAALRAADEVAERRERESALEELLRVGDGAQPRPPGTTQ
ncbi:MAG: peptidase MA family metallohydrolase [Gemmatimonadota bacterium]